MIKIKVYALTQEIEEEALIGGKWQLYTYTSTMLFLSEADAIEHMKFQVDEFNRVRDLVIEYPKNIATAGTNPLYWLHTLYNYNSKELGEGLSVSWELAHKNVY